MARYVAFLRGINSGKDRTIKMEVLRKSFAGLGFERVRTILASGNVLFETNATDEETLELTIEGALPETIGFKSDVIVCTVDDLRKLMLLNPFRDMQAAPHTRRYVTFVKGKPETNLKFPAIGKGYTILGIFDGVVCSVVDLRDAVTPDLMQLLDQEFGKGITIRSWNTMERILKVATND
jgi:uncharacterized protein (DUF1697 family)